MNRMVVLGAALLVLAIVGIGTLGGWGWGMHGPWMGPGNRPGPSRMPHMGGGRSTETGTSWSPVAGAPEVEVALVDFAFVPAEIRVRAGVPVNLELTNRGGILHDLTIPPLRFHAEAQPGQEAMVGLVAQQAGTYEFYCSVPGHREAGMVGRLVVEP